MQAFKVALEEHSLRVLELLIGLTQQMSRRAVADSKLGKAVSEAEYYDLIFAKRPACFPFPCAWAR